MITSVSIKNFRSIESMELSLGKINVLTGANNSGKSSVIYALLALKNAVTNPNQSLDSIFNLGFINLGGFRETVFKRNEAKNLELTIAVSRYHDDPLEFSLELGKQASFYRLETNNQTIQARIEVSFPHTASKLRTFNFNNDTWGGQFIWNGLTGSVIQSYLQQWVEPPEEIDVQAENGAFEEQFQEDLELPTATIIHLDFLPIHRGFRKNVFSQIPLQSQVTTEDELATLLAIDRELAGDVAHYLEKIVDRIFSVGSTQTPGLFHLQTRDEKTGFTADLVNEGLGTNQLVTILAKALYKNASFICIDEPEIHLHPSIIDKLVNVLIDIANERGKQFLISTHSEHFINALLSAVIKKRIAPDEVKVYHLTKDGWDTKAELQSINEHGQIGGVGLSQFYAAELAAWSTFFKIDEAAQ